MAAAEHSANQRADQPADQAANQELTDLLKGRRITSTASAGTSGWGGGTLSLGFGDGSSLTVRVGRESSTSSAGGAGGGGTIRRVRQSVDPPVLYLDLGGSSAGAIEIPLAGPTSSVVVRDRHGKPEYAD